MTYDLTQVRNDMRSYRRRFNTRWHKLYGKTFDDEYADIQILGLTYNFRGTIYLNALAEYQNRIRNVKSIIER